MFKSKLVIYKFYQIRGFFFSRIYLNAMAAVRKINLKFTYRRQPHPALDELDFESKFYYRIHTVRVSKYN